MSINDKKARLSKLSEFVDLGNSRLKEQEIEILEWLVKNKEALDGTTKTYSNSTKTFDSDGTYRVNYKDTYTFRSSKFGIFIEHESESRYDDGTVNNSIKTYSTAREIFKKST
ncbi:hypothetical protein NHG34_03110 [Aerococcaceae bacterium NML190938]|nr:hypothetical protein [Aerococcaceae bacterium NML190938]